MAATVEIIIKTVDQSTDKLNKTGKALEQFGKNLKDLGKVLAVTGAVAAVTFKAFERGAKVKQTAQSFDLLLKKIGAAPSLLNKLDTAANGTISRMEIMSSTSILLAGAQGELASSMAKSTPRLLEIAKAANKLNPSLGTTSFLYESLGRGIKRSSPLILDNLGLVIKIGEANQKYADSLGISVDALTAEQKQMALLNETLRAGGVLIDQVGGDVDSLTDSTEKATAGFKNLWDAVLADIGGKGTIFGKLGDDMSDVARLVGDFGIGRGLGGAIFDRKNTIEDFNRREADRQRVMRGQEKTPAEVIADINAQRLTRRTDVGFEDFQAAGGQFAGRGGPTELLGASAASNAVAEMKAKIDAIGRVTPIRVLSDLDVGIASRIADELTKIDFEQAGGRGVQEAFDVAQRRFEAGKLTLAQYEQILTQISIKAAAVSVAMGDMTINEAARQIASDMNISFAEALALLQGINTNLGLINGTVVKATVRVDVSGDGAGFVIAGGLGRTGTGVKVGGKVVESFASGGKMVAGRPAMVGEEGPEIVTPKTSSTVTPNNMLGGNTAALEGKIDILGSKITNALLDIGQMFSEAVG